MEFNCAGGKVTFNRFTRIGSGAIENRGDSKPQLTHSFVLNDVRKPDYVSLESPNVQFSATDFTVKSVGKIKRIGWSNVILSSERSYYYDDGGIVTEAIPQLPTRDGGAGETSPFYFGQWWATDDGEEDGSMGVLATDEPEDLIFNDAPCLPPSYDALEHDGIPLGMFNIGSKASPTYIDKVSGGDSYLACLLLIDEDGGHHVAWSVYWTVKFAATVTVGLEAQPNVNLAPNSWTTINLFHGCNAAGLTRLILPRPGGAAQKIYTKFGGG